MKPAATTDRPWGKPRQVPPRLVAGALLGVLLLRFLLGWDAGFLEATAALALGACLWWVAKRQMGLPGAAVALGLFVSAPSTAAHNPSALGALGLFGMVYTGVGVAHALQGPRRKWPPRIALMTALTAFTAVASPLACIAGLLLASIAMVYLAQGQRRLLPAIVAIWAFAAAFTIVLVSLATGVRPAWGVDTEAPVIAWCQAGLGVAVVAAFARWLRSRRTRYFGNSAPLLAASFLLGFTAWQGQACFSWALPFALLFTAGCFTDGWEARNGHLWAMGYALICAWQMFASFDFRFVQWLQFLYEVLLWLTSQHKLCRLTGCIAMHVYSGSRRHWARCPVSALTRSTLERRTS